MAFLLYVLNEFYDEPAHDEQPDHDAEKYDVHNTTSL